MSEPVPIVRTSALLASLCLLAMSPSVGDPSVPPADPTTTAALRGVLEHEPTGHEDLSPWLGVAAPADPLLSLRGRPRGAIDLQYASERLPVRVHMLVDDTARLEDQDLDGWPDRAQRALAVAEQTLELCAQIGLGSPADDGDGELDLFVAWLGGRTHGYRVLERVDLPGRSAAGFVVINGSLAANGRDFAAIVARSVARLVLDARDASAPSWWVEPTVSWIETRVAGVAPGLDRLLAARWNLPEAGIVTDDLLLARGNVGLLWSLDDPDLESRVVAASWAALARRSPAADAVEIVGGAVRGTAGLELDELVLRAAITQVVHRGLPDRWAVEIVELPAQRVDAPLPLEPLGAALLQLLPDPRDPEGVRMRLELDDGDYTLAALLEGRDGSWQRVGLDSDERHRTELLLPWADYRRAIIVVVRGASAAAAGGFGVAVSGLDGASAFAFSAVGGRRDGSQRVEIAWASAWESGLFGWIVERAPSPAGPWRLVHELPLPAIGLPTEGASYSLADRLADGPADLLYYRVVALTRQGLRISGPPFAISGTAPRTP